MLKRILIALGALVLFIILAIVALIVAVPFLLPSEAEVKSMITAEVRKATGRSLTLDGSIDIDVLPVLAVTVEGVAIGNPPGMEGEFVRADRLVLELDWMSLLSRELVVDSFVLERPQIALVEDANGHGNWEFDLPAAPGGGQEEAAPAPQQEAQAPAGDRDEAGGRPRLRELRLNRIEIRDGRIVYAPAGGPSHSLEALDLALEMPGLSEPLSLSGSARLDGTAVSFAALVGELRALMADQTVPLQLTFSSDPATLLLDGRLTGGSAFAGRVELAVPSLPAAMALAGQADAGLPPALRSLALKAQLDAQPGVLTFDQLDLKLGELALAGRLVLEPAGARPRLSGQLSTGLLDLNALLADGGPAPAAQPQPGAAPAGGAQPAPAPAPAPAPGAGGAAWPDTPLDASALSAADLALTLEGQGLRYGSFQSGPFALSLALDDRNLVADLSRLALYGGTATGKLNVNARGGAPQFALSADLSQIEAEPVLAGLADFDRLSGKGNARAALTSSGATLREAVANLAGTGDFAFRDGAVKGINVAQILRSVGSGFREPFSGPHQKTDFSELTASYRISGGVLENRDLLLKSPLLRVTGAGQVSIIGRTVNYRLVPELAATTVGQGGADRVAGIAVPLLVTGPLEDPAITPDLKGVTENLLRNPAGAIEQLRALPGGLPGRLGDVLGTGRQDGTGEGGSAATAPEKAVEDAVRGLLGGDRKPADALKGLLGR